jgi:hypothetical protein
VSFFFKECDDHYFLENIQIKRKEKVTVDSPESFPVFLKDLNLEFLNLFIKS